MATALKTVGTVLGAVALVAGTIATGGALGVIGAVSIAGASAGTIATAAGIASALASMGSQALAKPPAAQGSVSQLVFAADAAQPYVIGEGYFAGVLRHRTGYGGTVDKVSNPYLFDAVVYSGGGPIESITPLVDFDTIPAWYNGYLYTDTQLGACPESTALSPQWAGATGWGNDYKLSGQAGIGWSYKFDKNGKRYASGLPTTGAYGQWVKAYDPRLDSTFPGGSGSHRLNNEATWTWSENPALHAGVYAYGRYQNGKRTMGIGLPADGINWSQIAHWANVCDLNGWTIFGVVFEPGDKWDNLKQICAAGGGEPVPGGVLSFRYPYARVALDTVTEADITDAAMSVCAMQSYRDRINEVRPKYRDPASNWELVQAEAVIVDEYVAEDGEQRPVEWPFNMVKDVDQAAQLAAYRLVDARELYPITLVCGPRLRGYRPGDCLHLDLPQLGLDHDAIILNRSIDPATMTVSLTFVSETEAKHAFALGETGTPPPTPALVMTAQERDETMSGARDQQVVIETPMVVNFAANYAGVVTSGLPAYIMPEITLGGRDIRTEDITEYSVTAAGVTATVNNTPGDPAKGQIEITAVAAISGSIDLIVTVNGQDYPAKRIVTQRNDGIASGIGGPGSKIVSDNSFVALSGGAQGSITDVMTVTVGSGENLYGTAPLSYGVTSPGSALAGAKWQYSPMGAGTWTDFGAFINGSTAYRDPFGTVTMGSGVFTQSAAVSPGDYDVRLYAGVAGSVGLAFVGTATIEAKV